MTVADQSLPMLGASNFRPKRPVTMARQRRALTVYAVLFLTGLAPLLLQSQPWLQAAGLGLWMPGGGFLVDGGWYAALFPLTLILFLFSLVAWFWAGVVIAPPSVWGGSAVLAAVLARHAAGPVPHGVVALALVATVGFFYHRNAQRKVSDAQQRAARTQFLPKSIAEVRERSSSTPDASARELSTESLAAMRYLWDRALQPVEQFGGFDVVEQFQPSALRYQINHMGFVLGIAQGSYLPNFHGYHMDAQNNLIQKYLLRKVWGYWVYESCWGHLEFSNFDPAARDNIMLTGWFGMHVGQYMLNSGDRRYTKDGSLSFRLNDRTTYKHDFHTIINSVVENYEHYESQFCLYPCEPNWIYPICNHYGMTSLAVHDRLFGTNYVGRFLPTWLEKLDTEFTDDKGSIIGLRSKHLGVEVPFPVGEAGYSHFENCFAPERAQRLWAIARKEIEPLLTTGRDGLPRLKFPGKGFDVGNYSTGHVAAYAGVLAAAREFGDDDLAAAAQRGLDEDCSPDMTGGVRRYLTGSNLANTAAALGSIIRTGDYRRSFVEGPSERTLAGPLLAEARYPDVLVGRAYSDGDDLQLVLYPGNSEGRHTLGLSRLKPGQRYMVTGGEATEFVATGSGTATLDVMLRGRTAISVSPAS